ncbi:Lipid phosphate phosphohydrolase 1 [Dufourea novaeangliae]|uniref:Lipid phosphate phosphohydrolase 1 n=2 Tax=Dufourea novaeangliae TaxID=178035 RepID=A0A154PPE1_DUFNO|nr:Lipid phosphate phosphohydrolase 1 [Dufourea novaeangliae]
MSICKNTIRWVLVLDIFLALTVIVLLTILEFGTVPQQRIGFYCNDPKISFKFMGDTISIASLFVGSLLVPILVMWIAEYMCHSADSYDIALGCAGSRMKQIWLWYGQYMIGVVTLMFTCDVMKTLVGEPRPHFLDTCKPREAENCTDQYVETYTCTNTIDSFWFVSDSSKSFPSGHSALSMFTTVFLVWYLQNRLSNRTFFLKPWLQCLICMWAVICSLTRIGDNRHHWWDVLAGDIFGLAFGILTVVVSCRAFRLNRVNSHIYNESIENGQLNFNGKRHQNVKKLLHETTVDLSEGRELKNASSNWKE